MAEIIPAILEKNFNEIKNKLALLKGRVKTVSIDFCDGIAVPNQTWPFATGGFEDMDFQKIVNEEEGMPYWQEFDFEFDTMDVNAVKNFDVYMKLGPKRIIFYLPAQKNLEEFEHFLEGLDMYTRENVELGISFRPSDDLSVVSRLSHKVDFLHCMSSDKVGFQGSGVMFDERTIDNIKFLKKNLPGIVVSVDIGINLENAPRILKAGADRLSIGSSIWKNTDPLGALESFQNLI